MSVANVTMIGAFPPPVGGAALINATVLEDLVANRVLVTQVDIAGPALAHNRRFSYHARRVARNALGALRARAVSSLDATLYVVPDAGFGAWYTRLHAIATARRYGAVVIHHHSCRYIEQFDRAIAGVVAAAGDRATHVFLTDGMATAFRRQYGDVAFLVAENSRFVTDEAEQRPTPRNVEPVRLGHLSNLCADKGFFAVADAFDCIRAAGIDATLTLAGPILAQPVADRITALTAVHGASVRHVGPVAGDRKLCFYRDIDLFLFPTAFKQEAAPLVVYEAMAAGCPVLATDRGLIAEIVPSVGGAVCARDADFAGFVLRYLQERSWTQAARDQSAMAIKDWMRDECIKSTAQYQTLIATLAMSVARP